MSTVEIETGDSLAAPAPTASASLPARRGNLAFGVLMLVFTVVNAWPIILLGLDLVSRLMLVVLRSSDAWTMLGLVPEFGQWTRTFSGVWLAELMLLAVWLLVDDRSLVRQSLVVMVAFAFLVALGFFSGYSMMNLPVADYWRFAVRLNLPLYSGVFGGLAVVLIFFRINSGWRLVDKGTADVSPPSNQMRFGLRQAFIGTAVFGGMLTLSARFELFRIGLTAAVTTVIASVPLLGLLALVLTPGMKRKWLDVLLAGLALPLVGMIASAGSPSQPFGYYAVTCLATWLASLAWLRICGLRLVQSARGTRRANAAGVQR